MKIKINISPIWKKFLNKLATIKLKSNNKTFWSKNNVLKIYWHKNKFIMKIDKNKKTHFKKSDTTNQ